MRETPRQSPAITESYPRDGGVAAARHAITPDSTVSEDWRLGYQLSGSICKRSMVKRAFALMWFMML